jgi:hypothetical protein
MVGRTALIAGITTASLAVAAISHVGGTEVQPRAAETGVQRAAAPAEPAPVLTGAGKKSFKMQAEPQTLQIAGANFTPGSTATIVAPLGIVTTFVSASLVELTPKSFKLAVTFDEPGTYELEIRTASGLRSNAVPIVVTR